MNTSKFLMLFIAATTFLFTSCQKEAEISEEEIVENIEASLKSSDGGVAANTSDMADELAPLKSGAQCGQTGSTTVTRSTTNWNRTANWNWTINCVNGDYDNVVFTESGNSSFNGVRLQFTATHSGSITATQIADSSPNYIFNGSMNRLGDATYTGRRRTVDYDTDITHSWVNVAVDKNSRHIVSGTGTVSILVNVDNGSSRTRTGNIVYNGNGTATLTMDNGNVYTLQTR